MAERAHLRFAVRNALHARMTSRAKDLNFLIKVLFAMILLPFFFDRQRRGHHALSYYLLFSMTNLQDIVKSEE